MHSRNFPKFLFFWNTALTSNWNTQRPQNKHSIVPEVWHLSWTAEVWRSFWQSSSHRVWKRSTVRCCPHHLPAGASRWSACPLPLQGHSRTLLSSVHFLPYTVTSSVGTAICFAADCHACRAKVGYTQRYYSGGVLHPIRESDMLGYTSWCSYDAYINSRFCLWCGSVAPHWVYSAWLSGMKLLTF